MESGPFCGGGVKKSEEDLKQALQASIDEVFTVYLGEAMSNLVYSYLETRFRLEKGAILDEPGRFADGLEALFGSGAKILLSLIAKSLASRLGIEYDARRSFEDQIEEAKGLSRTKNG